MTYTEMQQAVADAQRTINQADRHVASMAEMIAGRLRKSETPMYVLEKLKRELRSYNIHTGRWT